MRDALRTLVQNRYCLLLPRVRTGYNNNNNNACFLL